MPRGRRITTTQKLLILSVYVAVVHEAKSTVLVSKALRCTVKTTTEKVDLHYETVRKVIHGHKRNGRFLESRKAIKCRWKKLAKAALVAYVRNTVHDIFAKNCQPTVDLIHEKLCEVAHYKFSRATTFRVNVSTECASVMTDIIFSTTITAERRCLKLRIRLKSVRLVQARETHFFQVSLS
jgi:hypothetical protein